LQAINKSLFVAQAMNEEDFMRSASQGQRSPASAGRTPHKVG